MNAGTVAGAAIALTAAILYAVGGVLQHHAIAQRATGAFDTTGVLRGVRQPIWITGLGVQALGIGVQLAALGVASLVVVQTVMVTMVFWVPLAAALIERVNLTRDVWLGTVVVAVGVAVFVLAARPAAVDRSVDSGRWAAATAVAVLGCAAATWTARRLPRGPAAAVLGGSAGVLNVLGAGLASAALIVASDAGFQALLSSWLTYAAAVVLVASIAATAIAFAAGPVTASIPPMIAANPVVGTLIGLLLLGEAWAGGPASIAVAAVALATMIWGIVMLSRTRVLAEQLT